MKEKTPRFNEMRNRIQLNDQKKMIDYDSFNLTSFDMHELDSFYEDSENPYVNTEKIAKRRRFNILNSTHELNETRDENDYIIDDQMLKDMQHSKKFINSLKRQDILYDNVMNQTKSILKDNKNENKVESLEAKLATARKTSRNNYLEQLRCSDFKKLRKTQNDQIKGLDENFHEHVIDLKEKVNIASIKMSDLCDHNREFESENEQLMYAVSLLKERTRKQQFRLIDQEKRLKIFKETEPIFANLIEKFNFKDAHEVVSKLEDLENAYRKSYSDLLEVTGNYNRLLKQYEDLENSFSRKNNRELLDITKKWEQSQEAKLELETSFQNQKFVIDRTFHEKNNSKKMFAGLIDKWNKWKNLSDLWTPQLAERYPELDKPDCNDPLLILDGILLLLSNATSTKAGNVVRDFSRTCNIIWAKYLNDYSTIRGKPLNILKKFVEKYNEQSRIITEHVYQTSMKENRLKELKKENEKLRRKVKIIERKKDVKKSSHKRLDLNKIPRKPAVTFANS
eukprot:TRINITY_DN651_c0_g1_i1.p1 TRINITY_DN651_c0_g1~~TRINITY_DN651_c0_g1_i1.p1  ORF type:complete len:510 (+),score=154.99 TRINITY_DN651_c0_g1_i1:63-1592(+)